MVIRGTINERRDEKKDCSFARVTQIAKNLLGPDVDQKDVSVAKSGQDRIADALEALAFDNRTGPLGRTNRPQNNMPGVRG